MKHSEMSLSPKRTYGSCQKNKIYSFAKNEHMGHHKRTKLAHLWKTNLWFIAKEQNLTIHKKRAHGSSLKKQLVIHEKQTYGSSRKNKICSFVKNKHIVYCERAKFAQSRKTHLKMKFKKTLPTKFTQILWIRVELS